ncbi:MAG: glycosyltransferase family 2 protein [Patescibacteria group bacterium]|nr:glycosyltransferase family 2 protein [Patescibacteria group bacterium]MDE2588195.1 glycosyltransferase family 2 protein [Patescibacteria group bacterium]
MAKKIPELSIFFPFWNEEQNIEKVVRDAIPVAQVVADKWEILMVDDGSIDKTLEIAQSLAKENKHLRVISHQPNRGYGASLTEGLTHATYNTVVFTDGDGQFDFSEVSKFIEKIEEADMVIGFRKKRNDKNLGKRLLLMNLLKVWDFVLFHFSFRDIDCGFKMFSRDAINKLLPLRSEGAMITTEILAKAKRKKLRIKEVGVVHYPREFGHQSGANFPVIIRAVLESLILWYDLHYGRT